MHTDLLSIIDSDGSENIESYY